VAKEIGYRENVKNAAFILAKNYRQLGRFEEALTFHEIATMQKDSMFSIDKEREIAKLRNVYEVDKKEKEIAVLQLEKQLQQQENRVLILVIVVALLLLALVYVNLERHKKDKQLLMGQTEQLQQQKEEIRTINDQLEEIVAERTQELKQIIESLTEQNQNLQQFSYITSHNLRAPVARIQGLVNIFNQADMADPFNKELLVHLGIASRSLDEVIRDLTHVLSISKSMVSKEAVNLGEVTRAELALLTDEVKASGAVIHLDFSVVDTVFAIKGYIQSILHNLISNAIKYRDPKRPTEIKVRSELVDNQVCIVVTDNGLGVDSTNPYKIFGLYQRMHTHVEGKGLGLYLVKTQIEAMNGRIEVESQPHVGTEFRVYIPYA
jgi:signal transduction histidine kinase